MNDALYHKAVMRMAATSKGAGGLETPAATATVDGDHRCVHAAAGGRRGDLGIRRADLRPQKPDLPCFQIRRHICSSL